jgi:hypothetical protein
MAKQNVWLFLIVILLVLWLLSRRQSWFETRDDQDDQNTTRFQENRIVFDKMI